MWQLGQMGGRVVGLTGFLNSPRLHGRDRQCAALDDLLAKVRGDGVAAISAQRAREAFAFGLTGWPR
jgi:hypothetical protein